MLVGNLLKRLVNRRRQDEYTETSAVWSDWNERRMAAKEADQPFDEPAPAVERRRGKWRRRGRSTAADVAAGAFLVGPPMDHHFGGHDGGGGDVGGGF